MNNKSCFFIGHRYATYSLRDALTEAVEQHITQYGVTEFTVGHYGGFDRLVHCVLREAKTRHPEIKLYLLAPYALNQKIEAPEGFESTYYPEGLEFVPKRFSIIQANRLMVKQSDYLIGYKGIGNSRDIIEFAQRREKKGLIKVTLVN